MAPYDWVNNGGSVDILLDGEYGFTFMGSWYYSMEWVWNLRTKLCCIASGKWNVTRVLLQWFDIRYSFEGSNEERWVGNRRKRFYSEIKEIFIWEGGVCKNPKGVFMYGDLMETFEYLWVNIWCMLDWIIGFCHKVDHSGI